MKSPRRTTLASSRASGAALSILVLGCAGVKNAPPPGSGSGGSGGMVVAPPIAGLQSIEVMPATATVVLQANGTTL